MNKKIFQNFKKIFHCVTQHRTEFFFEYDTILYEDFFWR
jgi:hypothetical protein